MKRCLSLLFAACFCLSGYSWASAAVRVTVMPPTFLDGGLSKEGAALADYLQIKLRDLPDVEWVERGDLDKLLGEAKLKLLGDQGVSGVVLGRLLKADVVLGGTLEDPSWKGAGSEKRRTTRLTFQVIDLTNASVLAEESMESPADPGEDLSSAAELEHAAGIAQRLLTTALQERRAATPAIQLAPIFFANAGASPRLDQWEEKWQDALRQEAAPRPGLRLLRFQGIEPARQEQKLARLGFTEADPAVWQNAADGYVWGNYQEIPVQKMAAFEDTEVEAEIFLRMGRDDPQRFARRFAVKDFPEVSRALAREVLAAALRHGKSGPEPAEAGVSVGQSIFARLCTLVGSGFFASDPNVEDELPPVYAISLATGDWVLKPLRRLPFAVQRMDYSRRMLELACFFDPENDRAQILRWAVVVSRDSGGRRSRAGYQKMEECLELCEHLAHAKKFDAATFVAAADNLLICLAQNDFAGPLRRTALVDAFIPLLTEKLPAVSQWLDAAKIPAQRRRFLTSWLHDVLTSGSKPELRLGYLAAARPLTPEGEDLSKFYERLMVDLGDRKRVQDALMPHALSGDSPPMRPANPTGPVAGRPPASGPPYGRLSLVGPDEPEPLLAGTTPVLLPALRGISLGIDELLRASVGPVAPSFHPLGRMVNDRGDRGFSIRRIDGYGDQLILDLSENVSPETKSRGGVHLIYQASSDTVHLFKGSESDVICGDAGRALYRQGDALAWTDLLSSSSGVFSPEEGVPAAAPAMLGFDAAGRAVAVNDTARTIAQFDWIRHRWLALPAPPMGWTTTTTADGFSPPGTWAAATATVLGRGDAILFPLWGLVFEQATQKWRALPPDACRPPKIMPSRSSLTGRPRFLMNDPGGAVCVEDHLWTWNVGGITDFSLAENRVVWRTDSHRLASACVDGPFLWIVLGRGYGEMPALVLLDRASHAVSGVMPLPPGVATMRVDDAHVWLGIAGGIRPPVYPGKRADLLCVDKAKVYAVLNLAPPSQHAQTPRPDAFEDGGSGFYAAILRDDLATVRRLLDRGASANGTFGPGKAPALAVAAWTGSEAMCRLLIERGAASNPVRSEADQGWAPLETAAAQGNPAILQMLLKAKAAPTATALSAALRSDHFAAVELLRQAGAPTGQLADILTVEPNENMARQLFTSALPLPPEDRARLSILGEAADAAMPPGTNVRQAAALIIQALKQKQADQAAKLVEMVPADQLHDTAMTPVLKTAIEGGFTRTVNVFLDRGFPPGSTSDDARSELGKMLDDERFHPFGFASLLQHGAEPRAANVPPEELAEHAAAAAGTVISLPLLLKSCVPLNTPQGYGTFGGTLLCAAAGGMENLFVTVNGTGAPMDLATPMIQWLLDHGVAPDASGREGFNALHAACAREGVASACLLAGLGVDLEARDLADRTIFDAPYPFANEQSRFIERLRSYAPRSDAETRGRQRLLEVLDARGQYADLFAAVSGNDIERVRALLHKRTCVAPAYSGNPSSTPYLKQPGLVFLAVKNRSPEMAGLLLDHRCDPNIGEAGYLYRIGWESPLLRETMQSFGESEHRLPREKSKTPLILAAEAGDRTMVDLLLDHGAYAPAMDQAQRTAIDAAATPELAAHIMRRARPQFEAQKLVAALNPPYPHPTAADQQTFQRIKNEVPDAFAAADIRGETPLVLLTRSLNLKGPSWESNLSPQLWVDGKAAAVLTELHCAGIRLDCPDRFGTTPLHRAVVYAQAQDAVELVKIGFDPKFPDRRGITPIDLANRIFDPKQRAEVLAALRSAQSSESMPPR